MQLRVVCATGTVLEESEDQFVNLFRYREPFPAPGPTASL